MESNWRNQMFQLDEVLVLDIPGGVGNFQNQHQLHEMISRQRNNPRISAYSEEVLIIDDVSTNFQDHQPQTHHRPRQRNNPRISAYSEEVLIIDDVSTNFQDHQPQTLHRPRQRNFNSYPRFVYTEEDAIFEDGFTYFQDHQHRVHQSYPRFVYTEEVAIIGGFSNSPEIYHHHYHLNHQNSQRINGRRWVNSGIMHLPVLDIDRMSYEELLAFQETIGAIKTGLSEETILSQLKTRICHLNESQDLGNDQEDDKEICTICQSEYENGEKIGIINCGHEYHENCIKKWLMEKNVCPICKRPAL